MAMFSFLKKYRAMGLWVLAVSVFIHWGYVSWRDEVLFSHSNLNLRTKVAAAVSESVKGYQFNDEIKMAWRGQVQKVRVQYTFDDRMQDAANAILKKHHPDYAAIVILDTTTGRVLAMASYEKDAQTPSNLAVKAGFPSASTFKLVTATAAIERKKINPDHRISFNGSNYTLYKKNVLSEKITRWTRFISLKEAFARSINTAFGRLSIEQLKTSDLKEYAVRFGYNREINADFPVEAGYAEFPADDEPFKVAEVASGYNKFNKMSPVQGAVMAATIANNGIYRDPYLVQELMGEDGKVLYHGQADEGVPILLPETAQQVKILMRETVQTGTSRKWFRDFLKNKKFSHIDVGGKTGSLNGDNPKGKTDWFVGYAKDDDHSLAVAAITVNKEYWQVKSAYLAKMMLQKYFSEVPNTVKEARR